MEHFPIIRTQEGLHIEGFPDAVKVVRIDGPQAKRLADMALHKSDLEFADGCLDAINLAPEEPWVIRQALWRCAIVHFIKCFGAANARSRLSSDQIYKAEPVGMQSFKYFRDLRNKHFVHDDNAYAQSLPAAVLNRGDKDYKIEKIVCLSVLGETLTQANFSNLKLLIRGARTWVIAEFDKLCDMLTKDLERESYQDLLAREDLTLRLPTVDEIAKTRKATY